MIIQFVLATLVGTAHADPPKAPDSGANLVVNSGFELGDTSPANWKAGGNFQGVEYIWERQLGHSGNNSLGFRKTVNNYLQIAQWTQEFKRTGDRQGLEVSAWVKADKATKAVVDVQFDNAAGESSHKWASYIGAKESGDPPADHDWREYRGVVRIPDDAKTIRISLQMYGPGKAWFDDVEARYADAPPEKEDNEQPMAQARKIAMRDLLADNDINKRFFLIGPKSDHEPSNGYKLLLVLPGGDGSVNFASFVTGIASNALDDDYIVAQLVAPKWNDKQAKDLVWPIAKETVPEASFTTEQFVQSVIDESRKLHKIDAKYIYALGWSSGGPPVYSAMLTEDSPIVGGFVAMSVFHPEVLPPLRNAKGKAFYILHSPTDFINMKFPEAARDRLADYGGTTKLESYEGGHRWVGDVFGMINSGVKWLEEQNATKSKGANDTNPRE